MKVFLLILTFLGCTSHSFAQDYNKVDSLLKVLAATKNDTAKVWAMHEVAFNYLYSNPDSSAWFAQQSLALSKKINYERGIIRSMNDIGNTLSNTGSHSSAIEILLQALEKSEKLGNENMKATSLGNISEAYINQGDYRQAISYTLRSLAIDMADRDTLYLIFDYLNLGDYYEKANLADSALPYGNQAYQLALQIKVVDQMGSILISLGNIHSRLGNDDIALPYYRKAVLANQSLANYTGLSRSYYSLALLFKRTGHSDSSFFYIRKSYETALKIADKNEMLNAATWLASLYKASNSDSTVKYLTVSIALKDSLFNQEKTKQVQSLTINEQLRQSKIEEEEELAAGERKKNLQMAGIGAFIPLFFGIVLLVSKRKAKPKAIQFMGLLGLLLLFEFISLFLHPYIGAWTHNTPVFMLAILVLIAALLVPLHHKMDHWVKEKLTRKTSHISRPVIAIAPDTNT